MAMKGAESKANITKELLNYFGDRAFLYNDGKEIRVNCTEAGELVQVKITLTAAKVAVEQGGDVALPGAATATPIPNAERIDFDAPAAPQPVAAPTEQEKHNVAVLLAKLGL